MSFLTLPSYGFTLTLTGGQVVTVHDPPSETYGTETHETGGGGFSQSRVRTKFYSTKLPMLTVCGRLEPDGGNWRLGRDAKMGLLFTPYAGKDQAKVETIKGYLGLVGAPLLFLGGLIYVLSL